MPSCAVKGCKNNSNIQKKSHGITYHLFPNDEERKMKWIVPIRNSRNNPQWLPSKSSVVCSDHFNDNDLYITNRGVRRVTKSGYPKKGIPDLPDVTVSVPDTPNTAVDGTVLPSRSSAFVSGLRDSPNAAVDCTIIPSASSVFVSGLPDSPNAAVNCTITPSASSVFVSNLHHLPNAAVNCTVSPSASSAFAPILLVSPTPMLTDEADFDTPRAHKLRQKLNLKSKVLRKTQKKIKNLQQMVRRLKNRNKSLKDILRTLKKDMKKKEDEK